MDTKEAETQQRCKSQNVTTKRLEHSLARFRQDRSGTYLTVVALALPCVLGTAGLGAEEGIWLYRHHLAQSAADAAAISAATAYGVYSGVNINNEAKTVTAQYGFVDGSTTNSVTVKVNQPPTSGPYKSNPNAIEVIVQEKRQRLLSALFGSDPVTIQARSVAHANPGLGCLLVLDPTASGAASLQGNPSINLNGCSAYDNSSSSTAMSLGGSASLSALSVSVVGGISGASNITTSKGTKTGQAATPDPYAGVTIPNFSGCDYTSLTIKTTVTLNPGVYCQGLKLNASANVTLNPGTYYLDGGSLNMNGGATMTGNDVTLVFTSSTGSNYATASINGGASLSLTAPSSGNFQGIVIYGDRNMPVGTSFSLGGGSGQGFGGAVYLPKAALSYAGGSATNTTCTEVIADTVSLVGNSNLAINCAAIGTRAIGYMTASLSE
jgi:hypothetical protein